MLDRSGSNDFSDVYHLAFPNDSLRMKVLVYGVYAIELAQAILLARLAYLDFAAGFGDIHALNMIPAIFWFGVPILTAIGIHPLFWPLVVRCLLESKSVAVVVQTFYAYRIKLLTNSCIISCLVLFVSSVFMHPGILFSFG